MIFHYFILPKVRKLFKPEVTLLDFHDFNFVKIKEMYRKLKFVRTISGPFPSPAFVFRNREIDKINRRIGISLTIV